MSEDLERILERYKELLRREGLSRNQIAERLSKAEESLPQVRERLYAILEKQSDLTIEDLIDQLFNIMEAFAPKADPLFAATLLASHYGVRIKRKKRKSIKELDASVGWTTITGRLLAIFPAKEYTTKNGRRGLVRRGVVVDHEGAFARVIFWDEFANLVDESWEGKIVTLFRARVREGRDGRLEFHVRGNSDIFPAKDVREEEYPKPSDFDFSVQKLKELEDGELVNVSGIITWVGDAREFVLEDRTVGKFKEAILRDQTGDVWLILWGKCADLPPENLLDKTIKVVLGKLRRGKRGIEVHIRSPSQLKPFPVSARLLEELRRIERIAELSEGVHTFAGTVVEKNGGILLDDGSGSITFYPREREFIEKVEIGDVVLVENGEISEKEGKKEAKETPQTKLEVNPETLILPPPSVPLKLKISELRRGMDNVLVEGEICTDPETRQIITKKGEEVKLTEFFLKDESGDIRVCVWGEKAEEFAPYLEKGAVVRLVNFYVREGLGGRLELSSIAKSRVELVREAIRDLSTLAEVASCEEWEKVRVRGTVVGFEVRILMQCPECRSIVREPSEGIFVCPRDGNVKPVPVAVGTMLLSDETGELLCSLGKKAVEEALGKSSQQIYEEHGKVVSPHALIDFFGRKAVVQGRVLRSGEECTLSVDKLEFELSEE